MAAEEMIMLWDLLGDDDVSLSYITKSEKKTNRFRDVFCLFYKYLKELGVCIVQGEKYLHYIYHRNSKNQV